MRGDNRHIASDRTYPFVLRSVEIKPKKPGERKKKQLTGRKGEDVKGKTGGNSEGSTRDQVSKSQQCEVDRFCLLRGQ